MKTLAAFAAALVAAGMANAAPAGDPLENRVAALEARVTTVETCIGEAVPVSLADGALAPTVRKKQRHVWVAIVKQSCMGGPTRDLATPSQFVWPWKVSR